MLKLHVATFPQALGAKVHAVVCRICQYVSVAFSPQWARAVKM